MNHKKKNRTINNMNIPSFLALEVTYNWCLSLPWLKQSPFESSNSTVYYWATAAIRDIGDLLYELILLFKKLQFVKQTSYFQAINVLFSSRIILNLTLLYKNNSWILKIHLNDLVNDLLYFYSKYLCCFQAAWYNSRSRNKPKLSEK